MDNTMMNNIMDGMCDVIIENFNKLKTEDTTSSEVQKLKDKLEWYDLFVDYIYEIDSNKYNQGCDYADKMLEDLNNKLTILNK